MSIKKFKDAILAALRRLFGKKRDDEVNPPMPVDDVPAYAGGVFTDNVDHGPRTDCTWHKVQPDGSVERGGWWICQDGFCGTMDYNTVDSFPQNFDLRAFNGWAEGLVTQGGRNAKNQRVTSAKTEVLSRFQYDEPDTPQPDKIRMTLTISGGFEFVMVYSHQQDAPAPDGGTFRDTVRGKQYSDRVNKNVLRTFNGTEYNLGIRKRYSRDADASRWPARELPR